MADYGEDDVHTRAIRRGALAIGGGIVFALTGAWFLLHALGPTANTERPPAMPAPRLQPAPQQERGAYFAGKERRLGSWGWVDRKAGIAHMPLDDAMKLMAARQPDKGKAR